MRYRVHVKVDSDLDVDLSRCDLFVLDLDHDKLAFDTVRQYLEECNLETLPEQPYIVTKVNDPIKKHRTCRYFVLNLNIDPAAVVALRRYQLLCSIDYPQLANDLDVMIQKHSL